MAEPTFTVAIEDLARFRAGLRQFGREAAKELQRLLQAAAQRALPRAQARYRSQFHTGTGQGKHTEDTLAARASQTGAALAFGGAKFPWGPGQEFGSNRYRQFFPYTGKGPNGKGSWGRVIFPTVREEAEPIARDLEPALEALARRTAFPDP